ncbi:MAG: hypothetical protein ACAI44_39035 [Candidatus Sericytochromatia bacterium]
MVQNVTRNTAPLTPPARTPATSGSSPAPEAGSGQPAAPGTGPALPTNSSVQIGVSTAGNPLQTGDVSFPTPGSSQLAPGMQALQQLVGAVEGDMGGFLAAVAAGRSPESVDMSKGQNFAMAKIFTSGKAELGQLAAALDFVSHALATPPDPNYKLDHMPADMTAALRKAGLMVYDNKLFNLVTKQEVGLEQVNALKQVAAQRSVAMGPPVLHETAAETAMRQLNGRLETATLQLDSLETVQHELQSSTHDMDGLRQELGQISSQLKAQEVKVQTQAHKLEVSQQQLRTVQELQKGLARDGVSAVSATNLPAVNALLREQGIEVRISNGQPRFQDREGKQLSPAQVVSRLQQIESRQAETVSSDTQTLAQEHSQLEALGGQSGAMERQLDFATRRSEQLLQNHEEQLQDVQQNVLPRLEHELQDPATPPERRSQIERQTGGFRRCVEHGQSINNNAREGVHKSGRTREEVRAIRQHLRDLVAGVIQDPNSKLATKMPIKQPAIDEQKSEALREMADRLIEKAQQMEASLVLAPRPAEVDVSKMATEMKALLEEFTKGFDQLKQSQTDTKQVQQSVSNTHSKQIRKDAEYHLKQLKNLDMHNLERVEAALKDAIQALYKQHSASLPQTTEG